MDTPYSSSLLQEAGPIASSLFQESGDGLLVVDPATERVLDANPMACQLSEFPREELLRLNIRALIKHEQEWQEWLLPVQQTLTFHGKDGFLLRTRRTEVWIPVSVTISRLHPPGGDTVALFTLRDRREQIEVYRRLQRTESELRRVLVNVSDCLWSCRIEPDGRWRYRYLSPVIQKLTGRSVGIYLEDPHAREQAVDPVDLERYRDFIERLRAGYSGELEYRLRRPDESVVWVRESVVTAPEEGGLLLHGVLSDISERKRSESETRRTMLADRQRLESLAQMTGRLTHDFNNRIVGILGHIELARMGLPADSPLHGALQQMEVMVQQTAEWCSPLVGLGRTRSVGKHQSDLAAILRTLSSQYPEVQFAVPGGEVPVRGLESTNVDILKHLIQNALESQTPSPVVRVRLIEPTAPLSGAYELDYSSGPLRWVEVNDAGPGLSAEARRHLFEPLFSTREGHRGLGLALVLALLRGLGGAIQIRSHPSEGTCIRVGLPVPGEAPEPTPPPTVAAVTSSQPTILLADDEEAVRDVISRLLAALGCAVLPARHGEEAVALLQAHRDQIRMALIDLNMPRMEGETTLRKLIAIRPDLPIVVMSGYPEADLAPRLRDIAMAGYLQKPFRMPALVQVLRQAGINQG